MTNNNFIASLLRDDKSKMATLIACGASAVALIYYNREVRNQIANIFMVRFLLLLFVAAVVFRWSSFIIIISLMMMMMMVMTMPLLACERKTTRVLSFASVDITRDGRRVLSREREEDGEWINLKSAIGFLGPNSLSPPSSFHRFIFIGEASFFWF
jgi:hypothetical protein